MTVEQKPKVKQLFQGLLGQAFDENLGYVVKEVLDGMRTEQVEKAGQAFPKTTGSGLEHYVERVRGTDFTETFFAGIKSRLQEREQAEKGEETPEPTPRKRRGPTLSYLKQTVPRLVKRDGYVSGKTVYPKNPTVAGALLSRYADELSLKKDPKSEKGDVHFVRVRKSRTQDVYVARAKRKVYRGKLEIEGRSGMEVLMEYANATGELDLPQFFIQYNIPRLQRSIYAATAGRMVRREGWEKGQVEGRTVYRRPQPTSAETSTVS